MAAPCEGRYELARRLAAEALRVFDPPNGYQQVTLGNLDLQEGNYESANAWFLRGLAVVLDFGDRDLMAHHLEGLSGLASALGEHERAVKLAGAAETLREAGGSPLHPAWRGVLEPWLVISRQALGEAACASALAAGRRLPLERAIEEAAQITVPAHRKSEKRAAGHC